MVLADGEKPVVVDTGGVPIDLSAGGLASWTVTAQDPEVVYIGDHLGDVTLTVAR